MTQPHILIIGGGLIGLATARACVSRGARVTLAEARAQTGLGAGYANSGMIHPSQAWPWVKDGLSMHEQASAARDVATLAQTAVSRLKARMDTLGLPDISRSQGCYQIFENDTQKEAAKPRYAATQTPTQDHVLLGRPALYFPQDFSGNAHDWSIAETRALIADGVKIITGTETRLTRKSSKLSAILNGKAVKADHIILCTGHRINERLDDIGLSLPIKPVCGFAIEFDASGVDLSSLPDAPIMDASSHSALTKFDSRLRLSGTLSETSARPLWQRWCELLPDIMASLPTPHLIWSGARPVSTLGRPIIAQSPIKGLWVNSGHGHMGWTLSIVSGEWMANMIMKGADGARFNWPNS